jgi:pimeloyl-ACP methyl ester carboxylesterase
MGNNLFMGAALNFVMQKVCSVTAALLTSRKRGMDLLHLFLVMALLSSSGCAWLDSRQRQIIYRPTPGIPAEFAALHAGDERYFANLPPISAKPLQEEGKTGIASGTGQRVEMWWLPHSDTNAPTLLYFHGTFRTLFDNWHKMEALREAGFSVLAVDYRGWGLSTPITPSEQTILQDAAVAWSELQRREPRAAQRVIYGHSMGSGVAVDLASRLRAPTDYGALILESAFTSFTDVAREAGFLARFLVLFNDERFASLDKIARIHAPLLMIHGSADTTIPLRLGQQLFASANPPKEWLTIEGGDHSDLDQVGHAAYQAALAHFRHDYLSVRKTTNP